MQMWFAGEYRGATEHQRLVYTESVSDENDSPLAEHAGVAEGHPTTTEVQVELEALGGRIGMVMTQARFPRTHLADPAGP